MLIDKVPSLPHNGKVTEFFSVLFLILIFFPWGRTAYANAPYTLWAEAGTNDLIMEFDRREFLSNRAGTTINISFISGGTWYTFYNLPERAPTYPLFISADTVLPASDKSDNFRKLDENLDISISIRGLHSYVESPRTIPFDWSNDGYYSRMDLPLGINKTIIRLQGNIRLRLRRDISADEVLMPYGRLVAKVYGKLQPESVPYIPRNPIPVATIALRPSGAPYPISCSISINNQNAYDVKFGNLNSANITTDGGRYAHALPLFYKCNAKVNIPIKIKLIAEHSSFSTDYISTSNPDIGIMMKYANGSRIVKPMGNFTGHLINGYGTELVSFTPVKKPGRKAIKTGDFTASAVLMVSFE